MKTIGLLGGMAWPSTLEYYRIINEEVGKRIGQNHSGKIIIFSVDFQEIEELQFEENWPEIDNILSNIAVKLDIAGADALIICSNTVHLSFVAIQARISIPVLHIADAVGNMLKRDGITKTGLLGTRFLVESGLYNNILTDKYGIEVITSEKEDLETVNDIIYSELVKGIIKPESRAIFTRIISKLENQGANAVILGCTEIPLLISPADLSMPSYNTTELHARYAVDYMLK